MTSEANQIRPPPARVEQRPDAGAIARQHQALASRVPQRDRELAVEVLDERVAVALVQVHDHFGVGLRVEAVAARLAASARSSM